MRGGGLPNEARARAARNQFRAMLRRNIIGSMMEIRFLSNFDTRASGSSLVCLLIKRLLKFLRRMINIRACVCVCIYSGYCANIYPSGSACAVVLRERKLVREGKG